MAHNVTFTISVLLEAKHLSGIQCVNITTREHTGVESYVCSNPTRGRRVLLQWLGIGTIGIYEVEIFARKYIYV